jgi:hypothetical protein
MRMAEAMIGCSLVTTRKAAGYPECEALTAHPLALFSERCDDGAEVRRADERSERARNGLFSGVASAPSSSGVHEQFCCRTPTSFGLRCQIARPTDVGTQFTSRPLTATGALRNTRRHGPALH